MIVRAMLVFLGLMVVCLIVVVAGGAMLPRAHVARSSAEYKRPPQVVWDAITDYQSFPSWRGDVRSVEAMPSHAGRSTAPAFLKTLAGRRAGRLQRRYKAEQDSGGQGH